MSRRDWKGLLPREHGSWAYLLGPQVAALLAARDLAGPCMWFGASLLFFCAYQAFAAALRRKSKASLAGTIAGTLGILLAVAPASARPIVLLSLLPAGITAILGAFWRHGRIGRQGALEVLGIVALALQGGAGLLLGGGSLRVATLLSIASAAYFLLSLIWVRIRLGAEVPGRTPLLPRGWNIPASLLLLTAAAVAGLSFGGPLAGFLPGLYLARFLIPAPRRADGKLRIPRLGLQEAVAAAIFAIGLGLFLPA